MRCPYCKSHIPDEAVRIYIARAIGSIKTDKKAAASRANGKKNLPGFKRHRGRLVAQTQEEPKDPNV